MSGTPTPPPPAAPVATAAPAASEKRKAAIHEVVFVAYPKLLFAWPLVLAGFLFWPLTPPLGPEPSYTASAAPAGAASDAADGRVALELTPAVRHSNWLESFAWAYIWILVIVLVTMGLDVNRNQAAFLLAVAGVIFFLGLWLRDVQNFTLFGDIYRWFARLDVQYDRNVGLVLSILIGIPYLLMLVWARFNDYWRITHNEFEHYSLGRMDDSLGRGAKTIRTEFPDVLELLLGMAGTLIVRNANGTDELRRIPHVMFLPLIRRRLNLVLERMAVTMGQTEGEEEA